MPSKQDQATTLGNIKNLEKYLISKVFLWTDLDKYCNTVHWSTSMEQAATTSTPGW